MKMYSALLPVGAKLVVEKLEGFGGVVRLLRPLLWEYGPKKPLPKAPAGALGRDLWVRIGRAPHFATTNFATTGAKFTQT